MTDSFTESIQRHFLLGKQGLWPGRRWTGKEGAAQALDAVEALQIDPVSIVASSPDIALWGRVNKYEVRHRDELLYSDRRFFDYGGLLMIYPIEELPYWRVMMNRRKSEQRWYEFAQANQRVLNRVREEIRARGPLRSRDIQGKSTDHYRSSKDTGVALYYLWLTGELLTHSRKGKERVYDLLERVAPTNLQWSASENDAIDYIICKTISQLGLITEQDFRRILKSVSNLPVTAREAKSKLVKMNDVNQIRSIQFEGSKQTQYLLSSDWSYLEELLNEKLPRSWQQINSAKEEVIFLSPLEYISARGRAKKLFGFDYIWEIYKPATKRKYGPYTMPVLFGDKLVARVDMKLERDTNTLLLNGFWHEDWFTAESHFYQAFARGLLNFTEFLGAERINLQFLQSDMLKQVKHHMQDTSVMIAP